MNEEEFKVIENMRIFGGSFIKSLAECFSHADPINFRRLKNAFPEYWEQYSKM